jgi:hypothetical protein
LGLGGNDGENWETLLRTWMTANWQQSSGLYGYKGKISEISGGYPYPLSLTKHTFPGSESCTLYPGEGVFSNISAPYTPPTGSGEYIRYAGIGSSEEPDTSGSGYTGTLLTFNANTSVGGSRESGYIAGMQNQVQTRQNSAVSENGVYLRTVFAGPEETYPIDGAILLKKLERERNAKK